MPPGCASLPRAAATGPAPSREGGLGDVVLVRTSGDLAAVQRRPRRQDGPGRGRQPCGRTSSTPWPRTVSPPCTARRRTSPSSATRSVAGWAGTPASSASPRTASRPSSSSPPTGRSCGPTPTTTRTCSGRCAAVVAASAWSPRSSSGCTPIPDVYAGPAPLGPGARTRGRPGLGDVVGAGPRRGHHLAAGHELPATAAAARLHPRPPGRGGRRGGARRRRDGAGAARAAAGARPEMDTFGRVPSAVPDPAAHGPRGSDPGGGGGRRARRAPGGGRRGVPRRGRAGLDVVAAGR